mgnify:FL=1
MRAFSKVWVLMVVVALVLAACGGRSQNQGQSSPSPSPSPTSTPQQTQGTQSPQPSQPSYPTKAIEVYVPAAPGGGTDVTARIATEYLKEVMGVNFAIINETGGGGALAMEAVRTAAPDGYKILYYHEAMHTAKATNKVQYDATSLTPLGVTASQNQTYLVSAKSPWQTLDDFVQHAKNNPGKLKVGVQLGGTTQFMAGMLEVAAGIDLDILEAGTESERVAALLGGQFDMIIGGVQTAKQYGESGDFRALAVLGGERDPMIPDVPTAKEQGYDVEFGLTFTFFGPKGLPQEVLDVWENALKQINENPDYIEAISQQGNPIYMTQKETEEFVYRMMNSVFETAKALGY